MTGDTVDRLETKLRSIIAAYPGQAFAVVDGGQFEDLPAVFRRERLFARSLFLDQAHDEVRKAGPWLVALGQTPDATDRVFAIVGARPAAVFWCCDAGEAVLFRHLRSMNMVRIPTWAADGKDGPEADSGHEYTNVFFRHFDPRTLGALMPVLPATQFARFLGPAEEVAFLATDYGGARRITRDITWPAASPGMLTIRSEQMDALGRRKMDASRQRIASYLRDAAPEDTARLTNEEVWSHLLHSEEVGRGHGLCTERAQAKWAYLMLMTRGGVATAPGVRSFLQASNSVPDRQMDVLMKSLIAGRQRLGDP